MVQLFCNFIIAKTEFIKAFALSVSLSHEKKSAAKQIRVIHVWKKHELAFEWKTSQSDLKAVQFKDSPKCLSPEMSAENSHYMIMWSCGKFFFFHFYEFPFAFDFWVRSCGIEDLWWEYLKYLCNKRRYSNKREIVCVLLDRKKRGYIDFRWGKIVTPMCISWGKVIIL